MDTTACLAFWRNIFCKFCANIICYMYKHVMELPRPIRAWQFQYMFIAWGIYVAECKENVHIYQCFTLNGFHESFSGAMAGVSCVLQSNALNTVSIGLNQDVNEKRASNCMSHSPLNCWTLIHPIVHAVWIPISWLKASWPGPTHFPSIYSFFLPFDCKVNQQFWRVQHILAHGIKNICKIIRKNYWYLAKLSMQ